MPGFKFSIMDRLRDSSWVLTGLGVSAKNGAYR
jgi:hypothetical protein